MSASLVFCSVLTFAQASGGGATSAELEGIYRRVAKASDLDSAGAVLSAVLVDETKARSAFLTTASMDERTAYLLLAGPWSSYPKVSWAQAVRLQLFLAESISSKPAMIGSVIRAERYHESLWRQGPHGSTRYSFPFFSHSTYSDDLVEIFIERLRSSAGGPARDLMSPLGNSIAVPAEEIEVDLVRTWQLVCGVCDRLDLIDGVTSKNWRRRFPELAMWFSQNRPFLLWDNTRSCMRIDEEAKKDFRPTRRAQRTIPELKPPWNVEQRPK